MVGLFILLVLVIAFYVGGRRGTALQLVYSLGHFLSFLVACLVYEDLGKKLELFIPYPSVTPDSKMVFYDQTTSLDLDKAFYAAVAFLLVMFTGWLLTKLAAVFLSNLRFRRILATNDWLVSGVLSALGAYLVIFFILFLFSMIPLATIQNLFRDSIIARSIVEYTPLLSWLFRSLWVTSIL